MNHVLWGYGYSTKKIAEAYHEPRLTQKVKDRKSCILIRHIKEKKLMKEEMK